MKEYNIKIRLPNGEETTVVYKVDESKDSGTIANELIEKINADPRLSNVKAQRVNKTERKLNFKIKDKEKNARD